MADFKSVIANMFRQNNGSKILTKARKKTEKYVPYTSEETAKIQAISRLPLSMQQQAYKSDKALAKRVSELTPKSIEARPFVGGAMNVTGQNLIKKLESATGQKLDTKEVQDSALFKAGSLAGEVANFALTGGVAGGAVAGLVTKGKELGTLAKLGANVTGDVLASTPYNLTQAAQTAVGTKNPEKEFAKNFAINTALDVGIGGAINVVPLIAKALKKVPDTKVVGDALEKGGAIKDAQDVKVQQAVKNLTQRKLKAGSTIVQPTPEAQMVVPQVPEQTTQAIKNIQQRKLNAESALAKDKGRQFIKAEDGSTSLKYTPKELEKLKKQNDYYKTGYVTSMTPDDFLSLTTNKKLRKSLSEKIETNPQYKGGKLKKGSIDRDFMFIDVDPKTWNVIGHEGRHRMLLLKNAGIKDVDILIRFPKYEGNTVPFENITLNPQKEDGKLFGEKSVTLKELSPLSGDLAEQTIAKYSAPIFQPKRLGSQPIQPTIPQQANIQPQPLQPSTVVPTQPKAPTTPIKGKVKKAKPLPNATILSKAPTEKKMNLLKEAIEELRLRMVDTFTPQEDFARNLRKTDYQVGERLLGIINKARNSREIARNNITYKQVDSSGREVGEALTTFMDRIPEDKSDLFQEYIFTKHHIDRLAKGKPILNLTKSQSIQRLQDISNSLTPAEMKLFNDTNLSIRKYIDNLRQYGIDTGLITQKQIDLFESMYPNYIKTARDRGVDLLNTNTSNPAVKSIIKNASRSDLPILPLKNQLEILTNDYIVIGNYNNMIREIANAKGIKGTGSKQVIGGSLTSTPTLGSTKDTNFVKFFDNGKEYKLPVSKKEAKSYKLLMEGGMGKGDTAKAIGDVLTPINTWFKLPITGVNPIFMVKNFMRDFEDALFYTKDLKGFMQNYPQAYKELATKGDYFQLYQASGGKYSTFSNLDKDLKDKRTWFTRNISERIEGANAYVEQIPRMTEFMNVLKKELNGKPLDQATGDMINKASLAASEITTNFGRSGDIGKYLNRTGVPFLNPSIQGGSRIIRQLTGQDGFKGYMRLATKAATLGIVPAVLNEMIYGDDPEYQQFNDRDKEISFIFKVGDTWVKVPKGRLLSAMGMIPQALMGQLKGDEYDFAELFKVMGGQIGPVNPLESNLFTPLIQAATNKTWYGGEIDGQRWDDIKKTERYDETTSAIGKFLGGFGISTFGDTNINLSPRQWDYVIDGYTGIFGDTILPFLREDKTRRNPIKQAFSLDPVMQNDLSNNFYNLYDKTTVLGKEPTVNEQLSKRFMDRYKAKADDVLAQIREVQESNISDEQKQTEIRELRTVLNNIYSNAEFQLTEFQGFVDSSIAKYGDEEKGYQDAVIQAQLKTGTEEWEAYTTFMEGKKKDDYKIAKDAGISAQTYYDAFNGVQLDDKDATSQFEAYTKLESLDLTREQKAIMWNKYNSGWVAKNNPYLGGAIPVDKSGETSGIGTTSGGGGSSSKTKAIATAYRNGLATKQVNALKNLTVEAPNLSSAEIKAIIKMLST